MRRKIDQFMGRVCAKVFLSIVKSTVGGVCVRVRTDSPGTPLPKQLTASTTSSNYLMRVVGRRHMGFSLMAKV